MPSPDDERRSSGQLRAILLADMKDFSRVMGWSEAEAIARIEAIRDVFARVVPGRGGNFEVSGGDTFLALFASAAEAVAAGIEIQAALVTSSVGRSEPLLIRIGVHMGEVVETTHGHLGDSINTTARIQSVAPAGGVTVSDDVHRAVRNRVPFQFVDRGPQRLKNIRDEMRVYDVVAGHGAAARPHAAAGSAPTVPSRGVLVGAALGVALALAGGGWWLAARSPAAPGRPTALVGREVAAPAAGTIVVGVMEIQRRGDVPDWMTDATRDALNTVLSKFPTLRVFAKQKIDFLRAKRSLSEIEAAEELGITKMVSGTLSVINARMSLQLQIVDIASGLLQEAGERRGSEATLVQMQNEAAIAVARALRVEVTEADVRKLFAQRTNDQLEFQQLIAESMGLGDDGPPATPSDGAPTSRWWPAPATARAADGAEEHAVRTALDRYRAALEAKDLDQIAAVYVEVTDGMREALGRYFANADQLRVQFSDIDVLVEGDEAVATFTRNDTFKDLRSGREVAVEVRVSSSLARQAGAWKIKVLKKSS